MKYFWYIYTLTIAVEVPMAVLTVSVFKQNSKMGIVLLIALYILTVVINPLALYKIGRPLNIQHLETLVRNTAAGVFLIALVLLFIFDFIRFK